MVATLYRDLPSRRPGTFCAERVDWIVPARVDHGKFVLWEYAVSAPGYAIAWGYEPS